MLILVISLISIAAAAGICAGAGSFGSLAWLWMLPVSALGCFLALAAVYFFGLWFLCAIVDTTKPQQKDNKFYRFITTITCQTALQILRMQVHTQGMEKLPKEGRFLLVCNHLDNLDPVTLLAMFPKSELAFISKRENGTMFLVGKLMHRIMCQPINRENDREALKTILKCVQLLKDDMVSVGVFPEGYVSVDSLLHPFRHGVFKIAQRAKVPIVVCTLQNTHKPFKNILRLKATDIHLHLVDVIPAEELEGATTVEIGNRVHQLMANDLGPELVLQEG